MGLPLLRGWANYAWQSDHAQFYLVDCEDISFAAPVDITPAMMRDRFFTPAAGLVVYTSDCLQQHLRIAIYDREPDHLPIDPFSGNPWTQVELTTARFPSRRFAVSSPSTAELYPDGPLFLLQNTDVAVRIAWMELPGRRYSRGPAEPDVIEVTLWPG